MNEEKKTYSIIGTVTIGTDEYRDLLIEKCEAKADADKQRNDWYKEYVRANKAEEENKKLREEVDKLKQYIKDNNEEDSYELWIVRSSRSE